MAIRQGTEERFWSKVNFLGPTPEHVPGIGNCWAWTAGSDVGGYGVFWIDRRSVKAHRQSWKLAFGPIPDGLFVLHRCDNRPCVNPGHLWLGTLADNSQDMMSKGRKAPVLGELHGHAKLTEEQVREIRRQVVEGKVQRAIARAFGVCPQTVCLIAQRATWTHVT